MSRSFNTLIFIISTMVINVPFGSAQVIFPTETNYYIHIEESEISDYFQDTIISDVKQGDTIGVYRCIELQNHQFYYADAVNMVLDKKGKIYRADGTTVKKMKIKSKKVNVRILGTNGFVITQVLDKKRDKKVILIKKEWDGIPN